jgi:hypothetical protein
VFQIELDAYTTPTSTGFDACWTVYPELLAGNMTDQLSFN